MQLKRARTTSSRDELSPPQTWGRTLHEPDDSGTTADPVPPADPGQPPNHSVRNHELPRRMLERAWQLGAQAPPLTTEQRDRLAALLPHGAGIGAGGGRERRPIHP